MMKNVIKFGRSRYLQWTLIGLLILSQMVRLINFVGVYGGVEHDSGWFLGLARSLAETGRYTTMVSTMPDPAVSAGFDINQEFFQLQGPEGRVYFFVEGTVGPAQIIPNAIIIKLFGSGFWQLRAVSLSFYLIFLLLASWLLFSMGGFPAPFLFHLILFFYPHLSMMLGYEALGEVPLISAVLFSFLLFAQAIGFHENRSANPGLRQAARQALHSIFILVAGPQELSHSSVTSAAGRASRFQSRLVSRLGLSPAFKNRSTWFFLSGLAAGLALMFKIIALLPLTALGLLWLIRYLQKQVTFQEGLVTAAGVATLPLLWALVQLISIVRMFGFETYLQHSRQRYNFFVEGSGLGEQLAGSAEFFWYKFFLISEISHPHRLVSVISLIAIAAGGPFLIWRLRQNQRSQNLMILLWSGWLAHTVWFITSAENGWVRRYWPALILAILILSLLWSILLHAAIRSPGWLNLALAVGITLLIGLNLYSQRQAAAFIISDSLIEHWYQKHLAASHTQLPAMITPRADQEAALAVLRELPASTRVFYPENYKSAEMATLSGRIFYPLKRRQRMPPAEGDVILLGPAVISRWRKPTEAPVSRKEQRLFIAEILKRVKRDCPDLIFENDQYIICGLE